MSAYNAMNTAIMNKLSAGTALISLLGGTALYPEVAPNDTPTPYVTWNQQAGGDENQIALRMKDSLYYVRGYASTYGLAGSVAAQIDTLLHGQTLTVTGWNNFWCTNVRDVSLVGDSPGGEKVYSVGGVYRIRLNQT